MVVLVGGGTGNVGSAVVQALSSSGFAVKVLSRDLSTAKASKLSHLPGVSCVQGDMSDATALASAFDGVTACFLGCSNSEQQVRDEVAFIDAAQSRGCRYLVKLGTCGAPGYTSADSIIQYGRNCGYGQRPVSIKLLFSKPRQESVNRTCWKTKVKVSMLRSRSTCLRQI
ncbi:azoB [Symbiodinium necroappetens]|uniref:AzoB protein n=1 Tax=Symbiodinium necroappetens TaxID=1628268 RepID=A0A812N381_9DINO|nr:azoB [Symbiodinium necroappetens]